MISPSSILREQVQVTFKWLVESESGSRDWLASSTINRTFSGPDNNIAAETSYSMPLARS